MSEITEKDRRVYYQEIVYDLCNHLDKLLGHNPSKGTGVVCGTVEKPDRGAQIALLQVADKLHSRTRQLADLEAENKRLREACEQAVEVCHIDNNTGDLCIDAGCLLYKLGFCGHHEEALKETQ